MLLARVRPYRHERLRRRRRSVMGLIPPRCCRVHISPRATAASHTALQGQRQQHLLGMQPPVAHELTICRCTAENRASKRVSADFPRRPAPSCPLRWLCMADRWV